MIIKLRTQFKFKQKGFSYLGILAMVVILGIMAAIAVPNLSKYLNKDSVEIINTTQTTGESAGTGNLEMATLQLAEAAYMFDNQGNALTGVISGTGGGLATYLYNKPLQGTYLVTQDTDTKAITVTEISPGVTPTSNENKSK